MWKLEQQWLLGICGAEGGAYLEQEFLKALPTLSAPRTVTMVYTRVTSLIAGPLFKYAPKSSQGSLRGAAEMISKLHIGMSPAEPKGATTFLRAVWDSLPFFARAEKKVAGKVEKIVGAEAAAEKLRLLKAIAKPTFADVEEVAIFEFLLVPSQRAELQAALQLVEKEGKAKKVPSTKAAGIRATTAARKKKSASSSAPAESGGPGYFC